MQRKQARRVSANLIAQIRTSALFERRPTPPERAPEWLAGQIVRAILAAPDPDTSLEWLAAYLIASSGLSDTSAACALSHVMSEQGESDPNLHRLVDERRSTRERTGAEQATDRIDALLEEP